MHLNNVLMHLHKVFGTLITHLLPPEQPYKFVGKFYPNNPNDCDRWIPIGLYYDSGYGIYYPDKTETQKRGIRIDIPVKKTIESVINDQDVILDEALKYLKAKGFD